MTDTPPPGWFLDSTREQEIRDQYAELGASTSIAAVGPYSALGDLLAEIDRLRAERDQFADRVDTLTAVCKSNKLAYRTAVEECQRLQAALAARTTTS